MTAQTKTPELVPALTAAERHAIETFYSAWKKQQPGLLDEVCTPDWKDIPLAPGQANGPKGLKDIIRKFSSVFSDVEVIIHEIFGTHERAGVRAQIAFTNPHNVPGVSEIGNSVSITLHEFHYLKDGRLTHTWHLEAGDFQNYALFALK